VWWRDAVIYQIYPRSFQDSDGDGVGDLRGIVGRLDHLVELGVDGMWLSPIHPSPLADFGYDVSDYTEIDPTFGSLADFEALVGAAHERGLRVVMDLVASHTSIEHPWFSVHPDWYVRAGGDRPPNNWVSMFGGSAWSRDPARGDWYLHTFYPEQPDLNWRNPEVVAAMGDVVRLWRARGVDGFRLDAISLLLKNPELRDDPPAREPFPLPLPAEYARLEHVHSADRTGIGEPLAGLREAAGDALLVGEAYLPTADLDNYLEHLDLAFVFELLYASWEAPALARAIERGMRLRSGDSPGAAWVLSNHDFGRLASRFGPENARVAALLLLTLPGTAFVYQGDEIGMTDGPGGPRPFDRAARDGYRHPMRWDRVGGFTTGTPWLPLLNADGQNVAEQTGDPTSLLELYRALIALRRDLRGEFRVLEPHGGLLAFERGDRLIAINISGERVQVSADGSVELATEPGALDTEGRLAPRAGAVIRRG
jgi:alpha-glucosidase